MAKKLTPLTVANAKPQAKRVEIPDRGCTGLFLIVQPSGVRSYAVRYRFERKPRKLTLGSADAISLADARARAAVALKQVAQGIDPAAEKRADKADGRAAEADTVESLAAQFVERYCKVKGNRTWKRTEACLNNEVLPRWKSRTVHEITKRDVKNLADAIAEDRPIAANRVLAAVRRWFGWMEGRDRGGKTARLARDLTANPCNGVQPPGTEVRRDRVLARDEICRLWGALDEEGPPFGPLVKLLLLTGQRRSEVAGMRWSEIDREKRLWVIPGGRVKNKLAHAVPMSAQATAIVESVTRFAGDFVFTATGGPLSGFSRMKQGIDRRMETATKWTIHDLRRTVATGMGDIGVQPHIIEAVLNHVSGHRAGVAGTYNRAAYAAEKADALQRWADRIDEIVGGKSPKTAEAKTAETAEATQDAPPTDNVTPLKKRPSRVSGGKAQAT
jgi:integrase